MSWQAVLGIILLAAGVVLAFIALTAWLIGRGDRADPFPKQPAHKGFSDVQNPFAPRMHDELNGPTLHAAVWHQLPVAEPQGRAGITPFTSRERLDGPAATTQTSPATLIPQPASSPHDANYTGRGGPGAAAAAGSLPAPAPPPPLPTPWQAANYPETVPFSVWDPTRPGSDDLVQAVIDLKGGMP